MICPNCGNEIPQGAKFCVRCGTPSPAPQAEYTAPTEYTMPAGNIGLAESGAQEEKNPKVKLLIALVVAAAVVVVSLAALLLVSHFRNGGEEPDAVEEREDNDDDSREKRRQDRDKEQEKEKEENRQEDAEADDGGQQEADDTPRTVELTDAQRDGLEDFVETMAWCLWDGDAASADFDTDFCYSFLGHTAYIISYDDFIRLYPDAYLINDYTLYVPEAALQKFVKDSLGVSYDEDILHQYASGEAGYWSYDGAGYYITGIDGGDFWVDEPEIEEVTTDADGSLLVDAAVSLHDLGAGCRVSCRFRVTENPDSIYGGFRFQELEQWEPVYDSNADAAEVSEEFNLFAQLPSDFMFTSGAGAWSTDLTIYDDGTFVGSYHDADMGDDGEGYPNGTYYLCNFSGKFSTPVQIDEYSYSMKLEYLNMEETPGTETYEEGMRIIYSDPYGLENADTFIVYLPGTPVSYLPEEFVSWIYGLWEEDTMPFYGIYNVAQQQGFSSY